MDDSARNRPLKRAADSVDNGGVRRVAIIDDDYWALEGQRARLDGHPQIIVIGTVSHPEASAWITEWDDVDVALIDAFDPDEQFDRFPGVGVVDSLRRRRRPDQTVAIVISGHMSNQLLKQRMFEAGADYYFHRSDVQTLDALVAAILHEDSAVRIAEADPVELAEVGLNPGARPNAAIAEVIAAGMNASLDRDRGQKNTDASRRDYINLRRRVSAHARMVGGVQSAATSDMTSDAPATWRATKQFLNRALGRELGPFKDED